MRRIWMLEGGDGYECTWVLGLYRNEKRLNDELRKSFSDFIDYPDSMRSSVRRRYRPRFVEDETGDYEDREDVIERELEEADIRQGVNVVFWGQVEIQ